LKIGPSEESLLENLAKIAGVSKGLKEAQDALLDLMLQKSNAQAANPGVFPSIKMA
jgi:hypothetical protein